MSKLPSYPTGTAALTTELIGTSDVAGTPTTQNFLAGDVASLSNVAAPATASSTGTAGSYAIDASYAYFCVSTDTWLRTAIATW